MKLISHWRRGSWYFAATLLAGLFVPWPLPAHAADPPARRPALYFLNADGSGWRRLSEANDYWAGSSPVVSPDGKLVVFDGWRLVEGQKQGPAKLIALDIDGNNLREFGEGQSASWSPDGKRIAFIQGAKLMTYDVESGEVHQVLGGGANPYNKLFWNMAWSPDSSRICFKGERPDGSEELAIVDAAGAQFGFNVRFKTKSFLPDIAWHPRGDRVVFAMKSPDHGREQLYELDPDFEDPPVLLAGQDESQTNYCPCWTPDGAQLVLISFKP